MAGKSTIKTIIVLVIMVLVVVLVIFGMSTIKTYLSGAAVGYEPKNVLAKSDVDGKSATVTWLTEKPVMAIVEYGTTPASLLLRSIETTQETNHKVTLNSLKPNVNYYFRIRVREKDDEDTIYDNNGIPYSFKTNADTGESSLTVTATSTPKPTVTQASQTSGGCNRDTDYNSDGVVNSKDYMACMSKGNKVTPGATTGTPRTSPTAAVVPTIAKGACDRKVDYDGNGVVNNADYFMCLHGN